MGMVKVVSPAGWDFDCPVSSLIKIGSNGLVGNDRREFVKRSAANIFLPFLDNVKIAKDEVGVHLIALGASEFYGPNRNGDGFREATLKQAFDTFTKYARFYRNHKNKYADGDPSYGVVKLAAWNPAMKRVELLVALNAEKSAADRNGGFIATRELEKLARGDDLCVSMACRVPYDQCSFCGHKAPSRDDYCTAEMCKAGGCAENLTRFIKVGGDGHHLHVDNHHPTFFDISDVFRPADRTAWGARADYLEKAASDRFYGGGAKMATDLGLVAPLAVVLSQELPYGEYNQRVRETIKLAYGLADLQRSSLTGDARRAFSSQIQPDMDFSGLELEDNVKTAAALGALADRKIVLPLRDFARLTQRADHLEKAASLLPGAYDRMIGDGSLERRLSANAYTPAETLATRKQRDAAAALVPAYSLEKSAVERRVLQSVMRSQSIVESRSVSGIEKLASDAPEAEELARDYACYKAAALERISRSDDEFILTARFAEWQNRAV